MVFHVKQNEAQTAKVETEIGRAIVAAGGRRIHSCCLKEIAYHAVLAELPVRAIRPIVERSQNSIAGLKTLHHIRPQSLSATIGVGEPVPVGPLLRPQPNLPPILALLDGVPISAHPLLAGRLSVDDVFALEADTPAANRVHGTAMASLMVLGDRNRQETPLPRRIHVVPVMTWNGHNESLPDRQLIIDVIYQAVIHMLDGTEPSAPDVLIINLSLGNTRWPFHGRMSPWARLLDHLAWRYGVLFIVSAGNVADKFLIPSYATSALFNSAPPAARAKATLRGVDALMAERRIIAPAETVNGITVGALNEDAVPAVHRTATAYALYPYPQLSMANPSSRFGPGFANGIKPDILMPGSREHLRVVTSGQGLEVQPAPAARAFGLKVAAPTVAGQAAREAYISGTSAAAALASRTCHRIHDALETAYGNDFIGLSRHHRAVILKALLVHPARWPDQTASLIRETIGPADPRQHVRQKDNIRRFLGYGTVDGDDAVACAADRATFWATGAINPEQSVVVDVPIPMCIGGKAQPHAVWATGAWFTPVRAERQRYRAGRLTIIEPEGLGKLKVESSKNQPDQNQIKRGTVISRRWEGQSAPVVNNGMTFRLVVQRELDSGDIIDDPIPFGLAVTLAMPGMIDLYDQVRARLDVSNLARVRP